MWMAWGLGVHFTTVIIHGSVSVVTLVVGLLLVEILAQSSYACIGEDAEDISLMIIELLWRWSAKSSQFFMEERLYTCQAEMSQARAVVE